MLRNRPQTTDDPPLTTELRITNVEVTVVLKPNQGTTEIGLSFDFWAFFGVPFWANKKVRRRISKAMQWQQSNKDG